MARGRSRKLHGGSKGSKTFSPSHDLRLCECAEKAWNSGDGTCSRCGKTLRGVR